MVSRKTALGRSDLQTAEKYTSVTKRTSAKSVHQTQTVYQGY